MYVAAMLPAGAAQLLFQFDTSYNWRSLRWPMAEFMRGVALNSQDDVVRATIFQNADLSSAQLLGASILVGYGTDADEMLRGARYRTVFTVTQQ